MRGRFALTYALAAAAFAAPALAQVRADIEASRSAVESELDQLTARFVDLGLASWTGPEGSAQQ